MPFLRGTNPVRRTLKYLSKGPLVFKDRVKIMAINFNEPHRNAPEHISYEMHKGVQEFVYWNLPQVNLS